MKERGGKYESLNQWHHSKEGWCHLKMGGESCEKESSKEYAERKNDRDACGQLFT